MSTSLSIPIVEGSPWLQRIDLQDVIFADKINRSALAGITLNAALKSVTIGVLRNRPFEFIANATRPFAIFGGYELAFNISEYDDAFSDTEVITGSDLTLFWVDYQLYSNADSDSFIDWLTGRLREIRGISRKPILINNSDAASYMALNEKIAKLAAGIVDCHVWDITKNRDALGSSFYDERMKSISGDRISNAGVLELSRSFALSILPSLIDPRLKVVAVDLDHTLYRGVLGEDGEDGVQLTNGHRRFQERLVQLAGEGVLIAVLSKNELSDVQSLFASRKDFPLRPEHISAWAVSWGPKSGGLADIIKALRVGSDSVLFIDDNLGEVVTVSEAFPNVRLIHAKEDAEKTLKALEMFPGTAATRMSEEDRLRAADLSAAKERDEIAATVTDPAEYLARLNVKIALEMNPSSQVARLAELSRKTNQFNLALARLTESDLSDYMNGETSCVVSARLSDRLSDAGVVLSITGRKIGDSVDIAELAMSCRSLGRGIEDVMLTHAFDAMCKRLNVNRLAIHYVRGPRNQPSLGWLEKFFGAPLPPEETGILSVIWNSTERMTASDALPVEVSWRN